MVERSLAQALEGGAIDIDCRSPGGASLTEEMPAIGNVMSL
ncbi:hypothetical protein [Azohydromonas lata]|uniref:Uncharacterized protein n=1 Tax=Azohydromonas lata TaxID=45677 RepID=A0ABU5IG29_9BURK|nr:hypothetical protein [Azohydromonas lata]MDZ5458068.1 hypothetical protein [Azohydromonas lata]